MSTLRVLDRAGRTDRVRPLPQAAPEFKEAKEDSSRPAESVLPARTAVYVVGALLFAGVWLALRVSVVESPERGTDPPPGLAGDSRTPEAGAGAARDRAAAVPPALTVRALSPSEVPDLVLRVIERAGAAFAAGDFAEAVLVYNDALLLDPRNAEAIAGMRVAGERYRERRRLQEMLEPAERAFAGGDFALALQILYRLPVTTDTEFVHRCMASCWYDLGMVSLRAGDTDAAVTSFDEALAILPGDPRTVRARKFAERSRGAARGLRYLAEVEKLGFRRWGE